MNRSSVLALLCLASCSGPVGPGNLEDPGGSVDAAIRGDLAPTLPDGGLCGNVPSGVCNDCLKGSCCAALLPCLAEATCSACLDDPTGSACTSDLRFGRLQQCATASCSSSCPALELPPPPTCASSADGQTCQSAGQMVGLCSTYFDPGEVDCCAVCEPAPEPGCPLVAKMKCCTMQGACGGANMAPCCDGLYCQAGSCAACYGAGTVCSAGTTCCDGLTCAGGYCRAPLGSGCSKDTDCLNGLCILNQCALPLPGSYPCTRDVECQSGYCKNGACYVPCNPQSCNSTSDIDGVLVESFCEGDQCCTYDSLTDDKTCY